MPILDDMIQPHELLHCLKSLKQNKAGGVDGVPPGILKLLSDDWIVLLTHLFNTVFDNGYPTQWLVSKVFNIFKKGDRLDPCNYRGISVLTAAAKLYDSVLSTRFRLWYTPSFEQAGSQAKRGCEEQILTVRLLIDIARKTKLPLYLAFIDYAKAYDKVDRVKLLRYLDQKGCGTKFLMAIKSSLLGSSGKIDEQLFPTSAGVRQGAATSCPLFTAFIDPTVQALKDFGYDGWLGNIHALLLMDNTVVIASSWYNMTTKLDLLFSSATDIRMVINPAKSKYIAVNGNNNSYTMVK